MNCPNCGAALRLVEGRNYWLCDYCATRHFPNATPSGEDRVVASARLSDHDCPVCRQRLVDGALDGRAVRFCTECRGILCTRDAFACVVRARRRKRSEPEATPVPIDPRELTRSLRCPSCRQAFEVHPYYGPGAVVIDSCAACGLVWLDHGELRAIELAPGRR